MRRAAFALGLALLAGGCASKATGATDQTPTASSTRSRTNVITAQELRENAAPTLADAIRQLRPGWSRNVSIFVNENYFGGPESLGNLSKSNVTEIRFLSRSEAQAKWGMRYQEVIQVISR